MKTALFSDSRLEGGTLPPPEPPPDPPLAPHAAVKNSAPLMAAAIAPRPIRRARCLIICAPSVVEGRGRQQTRKATVLFRPVEPSIQYVEAAHDGQGASGRNAWPRVTSRCRLVGATTW